MKRMEKEARGEKITLERKSVPENSRGAYAMIHGKHNVSKYLPLQ